MPVVLTFDLEGAPPIERNRIQSMFERLGWQNIGGSSYRYPRLGSKKRVEDWFNHVVPALMLFRTYARTSGHRLRNYTLDVQSSTGYDEAGRYGSPPQRGSDIEFDAPNNASFGAQKLRDWIDGVSYPYAPEPD